MFISLVQLKLGHEERSFLLNNSKLIERWRVILRQCKNEDLRVDVRTLVDGFSRALDRKTAHIDLLLQVGRSVAGNDLGPSPAFYPFEISFLLHIMLLIAKRKGNISY